MLRPVRVEIIMKVKNQGDFAQPGSALCKKQIASEGSCEPEQKSLVRALDHAFSLRGLDWPITATVYTTTTKSESMMTSAPRPEPERASWFAKTASGGSQICAVALMFWWTAAPGVDAEQQPGLHSLAGQPAELSAWAYTYRADREVQEKPEACFVLRRLERLDQAYRPVSLWLSQESEKRRARKPPHPGLLSHKDVGELGPMLPPPEGVLQSALLWEGRMQLDRLELAWPKNGTPPPQADVEVRVYPSPFGWFGWQRDQQITVKPEISADGWTWVYRGDWNGVDMVAVFVKGSETRSAVPQIRAYGPEHWRRMDIEIEWGFQPATEKAEYDGHIEGYFGLVDKAAPLPGDAGTTMEGAIAWKSKSSGSSGRRGIVLSVLCVRPVIERVGNLPIFPYGHPRDTRITVWTKSGRFTFLTRDLEQGPILAPEYGFFVRAGGSSVVPPAPAEVLPLLLTGKRKSLLGNNDLHGWGIGPSQGVALGAMVDLFWGRKTGSPDTPWFAGNATDRPVTVQGITFPSRGVAMHPGPDCNVGVGWRSPLDGRVRLEGNLAHAQPGGGDGVEWSIVSATATGRNVLAQGVIDRGGQQSFPATDIAVRKGDLLALVIGRRAHHTCDSTALTLVITEDGGQARQWDLAKDVVGHLSEGNPCADSLGNSGVWSFLQFSPQQANLPPVSGRASQASSAREFLRELEAANVQSVRQLTRAHCEATWEEAMREIKLPLFPPDTTWPPSKPTEDPPMSVEVPDRAGKTLGDWGHRNCGKGNSATWISRWKRRDRSTTWIWRGSTSRQPSGWKASCSDRAPWPTAISPTERAISALASCFTARRSPMFPVISPTNSFTTAEREEFSTIWPSTTSSPVTACGSGRTNGECRPRPNGLCGSGRST